MGVPIHQSSVLFRINTSSGVPIWRQLVDQVKVGVATGAIARGERLPSVRQLSEELVINPTTVQRAFVDLEAEGVIECRRGHGTFVLGDGQKLKADERRRRAIEHLRNAVAEAHRLQFDERELKELFERELKRVFDHEE